MKELKIKQQLDMTTVHFAVEVQENKEGISICIFHRDGDLIEEFFYNNEDVIEGV